MNDISLDVTFVVRALLPFAAGNILIAFAIYFSLIKSRLSKEYQYYAGFVVFFILFLCGPVVSALAVEESRRWFDIFRNILFFTIGTPLLMLGLYHQANQTIPKYTFLSWVALGVAWSLFFILALPLVNYQPQELSWFYQLSWAQPYHVYNAQVLLVVVQLVLPSVYLLRRPDLVKEVKLHAFGVMGLSLFMILGALFTHWPLYYSGCSFIVIVWGVAMYNDVKQLNLKVISHQQHQNKLAIAQYLAQSNGSFSDHYHPTIGSNQQRQRAELTQYLVEGRGKLHEDKFNQFFSVLLDTYHQQMELLKLKCKYELYLMFDAVIFQFGQAEFFVKTLNDLGVELDDASNIDDIKTTLGKALGVLMADLNKPQVDVDSLVAEQIKAYVQTNFQREINLNTVAKNLNASRSHVTKVFKAATGSTINQYISEVRIDNAKKLLMSLPVTDVAFKVGFNNSAYFATVFKKLVGISPKAFKANLTDLPVTNEKTPETPD